MTESNPSIFGVDDAAQGLAVDDLGVLREQGFQGADLLAIAVLQLAREIEFLREDLCRSGDDPGEPAKVHNALAHIANGV